MTTTASLDLGPTPTVPAVPGVPPPVATGAAPDFERALNDLLTGTAPAALTAATPVERQVPAATGKAVPAATDKAVPVGQVPLAKIQPDCELLDPTLLPAIGAPIAAEPGTAKNPADDLPEPSLEPALAWLLPPVSAPPVATVLSTPIETAPAALKTPVALAPPVAAMPGTPDCEMPAMPDPVGEYSPAFRATGSPDGIAKSVPATPGQPAPAEAASPPIDQVAPAPRSGSHALPAILGLPDAAKPADASATVRAEATPALRVDLSSAARAVSAVVTLEPAAPNAPTAADAAILSATGTAPSHTVAPTASAQQAGIDLTRDPGINRMIDRIEQLRDSADVRETRIRLIPDALGPIDIAVRREGASDAVQVHFTAAEATTRQLIADAQQRLVELADARGVRIERATIDGGSQTWSGDGQTRQQPQQAQHQQLNRAPARAGHGEPDTRDERIA